MQRCVCSSLAPVLRALGAACPFQTAAFLPWGSPRWRAQPCSPECEFFFIVLLTWGPWHWSPWVLQPSDLPAVTCLLCLQRAPLKFR